MKDSLGKKLLVLYAVAAVAVYIFSSFSIFSALSRISLPLVKLLLLIPDAVRAAPIRWLFVNMGIDSTLVLFIIIQGLILYFGGNYLEKILKKPAAQ